MTGRNEASEPTSKTVAELQAELDEGGDLRARLGMLLDKIAAALKGQPARGRWHNWADLPTVADNTRVERDWLLAEAPDDLRERFHAVRAKASVDQTKRHMDEWLAGGFTHRGEDVEARENTKDQP